MKIGLIPMPVAVAAADAYLALRARTHAASLNDEEHALLVQQLEAAGLIVRDKAGRKVSPAGMSFLDGTAYGLVSSAAEGTSE